MDYKTPEPYDVHMQKELMEKLVRCPICSEQFTLLDIEAHADKCVNESQKITAKNPKGLKQKAKPTFEGGEAGRPAGKSPSPVKSVDAKKIVDQKVDMDLDPSLDFSSSIDQIRLQLECLGSNYKIDQSQIMGLLDGLRTKYEVELKRKQKLEDELPAEWVRVDHDDAVEELGGMPAEMIELDQAVESEEK